MRLEITSLALLHAFISSSFVLLRCRACGLKIKFLETAEPDGKRRPRYDRNAPKVMPAKFAKTTKDFEVFGFHSRQRRAYINLCMRYGLPPRDHFQERWIVRNRVG